MKNLVVYLLFLLILFSCQKKPQTDHSIFTNQDSMAIEEAHNAMMAAEAHNEWETMKQFWSHDILFLVAGAPTITGTDNYLSWVNQGGFVVTSLVVKIDEIRGECNLAYVRARYNETYTIPDSDKPINDSGKYIAIYENTNAGGWLLTRWIWNSDTN